MFRRALTVACVCAALSIAAATVSAMTFNRTTYFAFDKPVRVTGVVLVPGDYVFEIANPATSANVVQISDRKRTRVYVNALTRPIVRPSSNRLDAVVVFGETAPAAPRVVRAWYPAGVTTGYEFLK